jgi:DNA-binding MarR family transcriptional regulator
VEPRVKKTAVPQSDQGPLLGALLRIAHQQVLDRIEQRFREKGLVMLAGAVTQPLWDRPEGMRLTELAQYAGITKQSMSELVERMVNAGYVERIADPDDGRARRLRLTRLGRKVGPIGRAAVREVEDEWAARIGRKRVEALREALREIVEGTEGG